MKVTSTRYIRLSKQDVERAIREYVESSLDVDCGTYTIDWAGTEMAETSYPKVCVQLIEEIK